MQMNTLTKAFELISRKIKERKVSFVAKKINVNQYTLASYISRRSMPVTVFFSLCDAIGIDVSFSDREKRDEKINTPLGRYVFVAEKEYTPDGAVWVGLGSKFGSEYKAVGNAVYFLTSGGWALFANCKNEKDAQIMALQQYVKNAPFDILRDANFELSGKTLAGNELPDNISYIDFLMQISK